MTLDELRAVRRKAALARAARLTPEQRSAIAASGGRAKAAAWEARISAVMNGKAHRDELYTRAVREWDRKASR